MKTSKVNYYKIMSPFGVILVKASSVVKARLKAAILYNASFESLVDTVINNYIYEWNAYASSKVEFLRAKRLAARLKRLDPDLYEDLVNEVGQSVIELQDELGDKFIGQGQDTQFTRQIVTPDSYAEVVDSMKGAMESLKEEDEGGRLTSEEIKRLRDVDSGAG